MNFFFFSVAAVVFQTRALLAANEIFVLARGSGEFGGQLFLLEKTK